MTFKVEKLGDSEKYVLLNDCSIYRPESMLGVQLQIIEVIKELRDLYESLQD